MSKNNSTEQKHKAHYTRMLIYIHQEGINLKLGVIFFNKLNLYDAHKITELETALTVLCQNVRGLFNKYAELFCSLKTNQIISHLICLTDHHLSKQTLSLIKLENYSLSSSYSRILNQGGGVYIYIRTHIEYSTLDVSQNCIENI